MIVSPGFTSASMTAPFAWAPQTSVVLESGRLVGSGAGPELLRDPAVQEAYLGIEARAKARVVGA